MWFDSSLDNNYGRPLGGPLARRTRGGAVHWVCARALAFVVLVSLCVFPESLL